MEEEIFGPLLPIIVYDDFNEAIDIIQSKSKPLSLYLFSEDENTTNCVLEELSFGGGAINDTLMHLANPNLPFGGVGASGIGAYHGKYSFDTFSHMKSYIFKSTRLDSSIIYPPYKGKFKYIRTFFKTYKNPYNGSLYKCLHYRGILSITMNSRNQQIHLQVQYTDCQ